MSAHRNVYNNALYKYTINNNNNNFHIVLQLQATILLNPTVDGDWFEWSQFSDCSATCGGGIMTRNRTCDNPEFGGNDCVGESTDTQNCGEIPCPSTYFILKHVNHFTANHDLVVLNLCY